MKTNTQMRIKGSDGVSRVIANDGTILASSNQAENLQKVHRITFNNQPDEDELLLPAGQTLESEDEKNQKHIQRNISREEEPLYPVGINPNSK